MKRICTALSELGHSVVLVGRVKDHSPDINPQKYRQHRIKCFFNKGFLFYAEYNIRLFFYLMTRHMDLVYSVDMDTLPAGWCIKKWKHKRVIFDAHEYFSEVPELIGRPAVKKFWSWLENFLVQDVDKAITVSPGLAEIFQKKWEKHFHVILNVPEKQNQIYDPSPHPRPYILYQGMLNKGRGIEEVMDAMPHIDEKLDFVIIGEGDLSEKLREKSSSLPWSDRIIFSGWLPPAEIRIWTAHAALGLNLLNAQSLSYFYSLANKFFDYMHAGIPSVNSDLPEYRHILNQYPLGYMVKDLQPENIATIINLALQKLKTSDQKENFIKARDIFNWDYEKLKLKKIISSLL